MTYKKIQKPKQRTQSSTPDAPRGIQSGEYMESIKGRAENKRIGYKHQLIGLEIADLLDDHSHKALYIKLVKEFGEQKIMGLAKDIVERKNIKNKGAYFMRVLYSKNNA